VLPLPFISNSHSIRPLTKSPSRVLGPLPNASPRATSGFSLSDPALDERYASLHLRLLYHFEHELSEQMRPSHPDIAKLTAMFIREAFTTPYLMDELLAYSAAHKSTADKETGHAYAIEATRLQTRALTLYNKASPEISEETCLAMFIYSSLLAHHLLFDLSTAVRSDLGTVLDGLTYSIGVHRGISAIARSSWHMFDESLQRQFLHNCHRETSATSSSSSSTSQSECDDLLRRLRASELSTSTISVHIEAVRILQNLFDNLNHCGVVSFDSGIIVAVQDWLIRVSAEYVQSLVQRRPESLVVLAYYAVMLHRATKYWFVGDLGRRLIHLINCHLGSFWADWLEWPNQAVDYQGSAGTPLAGEGGYCN
jgi:hypothetical protein